MAREKLYFGGEGKNGKTYTWMSIADAVIRSGHKVVVIESDDGITKVAAEWDITEANGKLVRIRPTKNRNGSFSASSPSRPGLYLFPVFEEWLEYYYQVELLETWTTAGALKSEDWIVLEGLDLVRTMVSGEYADRTSSLWDKPADKKLSPSSWDAFINKRLDKRPILEGSDYGAIDGEIVKTLNYVTLKAPWNVIGTTGTEPFRTGQYAEDEQTKNFYAAMGMPVKFSGHKDYVRKWDTLVVCGKSMQGYVFQVFGDRGSQLRGKNIGPGVTAGKIPNDNFYEQFLVAQAGWVSMKRDRQVGLPPVSNGAGLLLPPPPRVS